MTPDPTIMQAVEKLDYRMTVGDVATQVGLDVNVAQQGLLALASEAGGHLQVAESGDVVYVFPQNFRSILRNKYLQLRFKEWWEKVWRVVFYLIRISFGIVLIGLIVLSVIAIVIAVTAMNSSREGGDRRDSGGGYMPGFGFDPGIFFWIFYPDYDSRRYQSHRRATAREQSDMNFLESVFSFLFGDGNPNIDLEERRWQAIGTVIRNNRGAVVAEQIAPYLDNLGQGYAQEYEEYMLPVLSRFNGRPEVSPEGAIVYHFPELQTTVAQQRHTQPVAAYLREIPRRFSNAGSGQIMLAASLGAVLFVLALVLNSLTGGAAVALSGATASFVKIVAGVSLGYGVAYLAIPLIRYFWVQWRNSKIHDRNEARQERAVYLNQADEALQQKIDYAQQFAAETVVRDEDLVYTTETDLVEQEIERKDQIDAEWQRRLNQGH
jgi:hypothetical protein